MKLICSWQENLDRGGFSLVLVFFELTWKPVENLPSAKDKLARCEMIGAKMSAQDFMSEVGTKSNGDNLPGILLINFRTSGIVAG